MKNPFDTPERIAFREQLKNFVDKEIKPFVNEWDEAGEIPWELHQKAGQLGIWGFGIDEKYGGLGEDDNFLRAIYNEEFSKCGAGGVGAAMGGRMISLEPIQRLCSKEIKERTYEFKGLEKISTPMGDMEALKVSRVFLKGENRKQIYWLSPKYDFSIVKIIDESAERKSDVRIKSISF